MSRIYSVSEIASIVTPVAESYDIVKIALFGSVARGEATAESDIDLVVDRGDSLKTKGIYFFGFCLALEEALGKKADIVSYSGLEHSFLKKYIDKDEVVIYERQR